VLSSARDVGELFIPALGAAGRVRRHNTAVALCALLFADACPGLRDKDRVTQALVLGLKSVREQRLFVRDQERMQGMPPPEDSNHADQTVLRRLDLARADPLRAVDVGDAVRAAAAHVAGWLGQDTLLEAVEGIDLAFRDQMAKLLAGQLPEEEETAAALEMGEVML
jgi:hypothetical protein